MSQDQLKVGFEESLQEAPNKEAEIIKDEAWAMMVELYPEDFSVVEQAQAAELSRAYSDEHNSEWQEFSQNLKEFTRSANDYEPMVQGPMGLNEQGKDQVMKFAINIAQAQQNSSFVQASSQPLSLWQKFLTWSRSLSLGHPISLAFIMGLALIGTWSLQVSMNEPQLDAPFHMMNSQSVKPQFTKPQFTNTPADKGLIEKDSEELNEKFAQIQNLNQSPRGSNQLIAQEDELSGLLEEPIPADHLAQKSQRDDQVVELELSNTNKRQPAEAKSRVKLAKSEAKNKPKSKPKSKPKRTSRSKRNLKKKTSRRQARKAKKARESKTRKSKVRKRKARSQVANKSASGKSDNQKKTARRTISKTKGIIADSLPGKSNNRSVQAEPQTKRSSTRSSASISPTFAPAPPPPAPAKKASSSTSSSLKAYDSAVPKSQPQTTYSRSKANQQEQAQEEIPMQEQEQEQEQAFGSGRSTEKIALEEAPQEAEGLDSFKDEEDSLSDDQRTEMNLPLPPWQDAIETWAQGQRSVALNRLLLWIDKHPYHQQRMTAIRLGIAWAQSLNNDAALTKLEAYRSQKQMRKSRRQKSNDSRPAASESRPASLSY